MKNTTNYSLTERSLNAEERVDLDIEPLISNRNDELTQITESPKRKTRHIRHV